MAQTSIVVLVLCQNIGRGECRLRGSKPECLPTRVVALWARGRICVLAVPRLIWTANIAHRRHARVLLGRWRAICIIKAASELLIVLIYFKGDAVSLNDLTLAVRAWKGARFFTLVPTSTNLGTERAVDLVLAWDSVHARLIGQ